MKILLNKTNLLKYGVSVDFFEAELLGFMETPFPLSAISFCSALLHKKDAAAIGARL